MVNPIDYETPAASPKKIDIRTFSDGGVTVTIPWRAIRLLSVLGWLIAVELLVTLPLVFFWPDRLIHALVFDLIFPALIFGTALLFGWRNNDPVEVISIGPKTVFVKPPNGWPVRVARHELQGIEIRKAWCDFSGATFGPSITLRFIKHNWIEVCKGRSEEETRTVAKALQGAMSAMSGISQPSKLTGGG